MKALQDAAGQSLEWVIPNVLKKEYELRAGDELFVTLHYGPPMFMRITAEADNLHLTLPYAHGIVTVYSNDAKTEIGSVSCDRSNGDVLTLTNGKQFRLIWNDSFLNSATWVDEQGTELLKLTEGKHIELLANVSSIAELPLLAILAWYLHIHHGGHRTNN